MHTPEQMKSLRFFIGAYKELEELSKNQPIDDYNLNQISRILRQFLFDQKSIISEVAGIVMPKSARKFSFVCCPHKPMKDVSLVLAGKYDGFHPFPDAPFQQRTIKISLNQIGSQIILEYKGNPITVRQLVKYIANKEGGIHFDQKTLNADEKILSELQSYFSVGGKQALTKSLTAIGLVVIDGLKPLAVCVDSGLTA